MSGVVSDIEVMQIRSGDAIVLKPRSELSDARLHQIYDQLKSWLDFRRLKVNVVLMPHDCDIVILRQERGP
jgi:hypothetical protein